MAAPDRPDYLRGVLDKGFVLIGVGEISVTRGIAGGASSDFDLVRPVVNTYGELLSIMVVTDQVPAVPPTAFVTTLTPPGVRAGIARALVLGDSPDCYELDLTDRRMVAYRTPNVHQVIRIRLTAHAANLTTFYERGLYSMYTFAT